MMYEGKWGEILLDWLIEVYALKKKSRRNNKIIFQQLEKLGFTGSYRTFCQFTKDWKDVRIDETDELREEYEGLTHPLLKLKLILE